MGTTYYCMSCNRNLPREEYNGDFYYEGDDDVVSICNECTRHRLGLVVQNIEKEMSTSRLIRARHELSTLLASLEYALILNMRETTDWGTKEIDDMKEKLILANEIEVIESGI